MATNSILLSGILLTGILLAILIIWLAAWVIRTRRYLDAWAIINRVLTAAGLLVGIFGTFASSNAAETIPCAILGGSSLIASVLQFSFAYHCKTNAQAEPVTKQDS
jgi:hypothetical protein